MRTISIINQKGGVGKTTSSLNISAFFSISDYKILLIDLDPQGNSSDTLLPNCDIENINTTYDFFIDTIDKKQKPFRDYIQTSALHNTNHSIDIMPANIKLAEIELRLTHEHFREKILTRAFNHYKNDLSHYDIVIIDCPPSLGLFTINAFVASDYLLVPVDASAYSHQGLAELINSLAQTNTTFRCNTELIGIFFSKYVERERVYKESYEYLKEEAKDRLFETVIRKSTQLEAAPHANQTIVDYAPNSRAYEDYKTLTNELIRRLNGEKTDSKTFKQTISTH